MEKLELSFENCYGIEKLNQVLDFSADNVITIYARNGLMKTSFSKTFKKIQENKVNEVRDEIYGLDGSVSVKIDGQDIESQNIFVIKSFENSYESNSITSLLIDRSVKSKIEEVLVLKDKFLKILEKYSGEKIVKTVLGQKVHELEPQLINDFEFQEKSFLLNIKDLANMALDYDCANIQYKVIFDEGALKKN